MNKQSVEKIAEALGGCAAILVLATCAVAFCATACYFVWNLAVAPLFDLPEATYLQSFLLAVLILIIKGNTPKATKQGA
jgi:TRAP-type mannitol/chloroaromatic compound transport system permease small subunit